MTPKISFVVAARNDNHGGDFTLRFQLFLKVLDKLSERYSTPIEIIIVEWNPPKDKPRLTDIIDTPNPLCSIKIITVPPEIHYQYKHSKGLPLYQMIGKNVGIRRASANFVAATNADIIFSEELFSFLAKEQLDENKIYRVDRYDVDNVNIPYNQPVDTILDYCHNNVIRINHKYGSQNLVTGDYKVIYPNDADTNPTCIKKFGAIVYDNACGDFQLMAKKHWEALRGYPELDMFSFRIDSLLQHMAFHHGLKEETLPNDKRIYHIEHTAGWTPELEKAMHNNCKQKKIVTMSLDEMLEYTQKMARENKPLIMNSNNWGLSQNKLSP